MQASAFILLPLLSITFSVLQNEVWAALGNKWLGPVKGFYLPSHDKKVLYGLDVDGCKSECEKSVAFRCKSFDYNTSGRTCYLQEVSRHGYKLTSSIAYDYYEITEDNFPADCEWSPKVENSYISAYIRTDTRGVSENDCKKMCEEEETFRCLSIYHYAPSGQCVMTSESRYTQKLQSYSGYAYFDRNCLEPYKGCSADSKNNWKEIEGHYINGRDLKTLSAMTLDQCKEACVQQTSFHCRSVEFYDKYNYCYLQAVDQTAPGIKLTESTSKDYYHLEECIPTDKPGTGDGDNEDGETSCKWVGPFVDQFLYSHDVRKVSAGTAAECMKFCDNQVTFKCLSIDFEDKTKVCSLQNVDRTTQKLSHQAGMEYYELECRPIPTDKPGTGDGDNEDAEKSCKWVGPLVDHFLYSYDVRKVSAGTASECMKFCDDEVTFKCLSIDFEDKTKICSLQNVDRTTQKLRRQTGMEYYERDCDDEFPASCEWQEVKGHLITNQDQVTLTDVSVDDCKEACIDECAFNCLSFDYDVAQKKCSLQLRNRYMSAITPNNAFNYYERNCLDDFKACSVDSEVVWKGPLYGFSLKWFSVMKTISGITEEQCRTECLKVDTFHCRSIRWLRSSKVCYLNAYNSQKYEIVDDISYNYHEIVTCKGKMPELEDASYGDGIPKSECKIPPSPTTPPAPEDPCTVPMDPGTGSDVQWLYYFNKDTNRCAKFKYLGNGGTINRFESKASCEDACGPKPPSNCLLDKEVGDGTGKKMKRFYYDTKKRKCKKFKYSGSGGNENNFKSKKECKDVCHA